MLNLKKTALAIFAFGGQAVFAGAMGPVCAPGDVTVSCKHPAWDFAAAVMYLKPSYSNLGNNLHSSDEYLTEEGSSRPHFNWGWGFKLEASYHFKTGNDLELNWYHFNSSEIQLVNVIDSNVGFPFITTGAFLTGEPRWDAVNFEFGQNVNFGSFKMVRFHEGVQYAHIQTINSLSGIGTTLTPPSFTGLFDINNIATYNGFGPRVGADASYNWASGFNIHGNAAAALLVGTSSFNRTTLTFPSVAAPDFSKSTTQVVPEVEVKLGATYTYVTAQGNLSFDVGWMWVNYFNAQQMAISSGVDGVGARFSVVSDFGVQGPYVGLKWVGNIV